MTLVAANQEVYDLLRDGIPVEFDDAKGQKQNERVRLIDFNEPDENRYLAVTQLWIKGERGFRRPDVLLYVNGLPLVFIELKNSNVKLKTAFDDNLTNYKREIPQLFLTNAFCVLSNAIETKVGSITAEWEHFFNWLRADDEKEKIDREAIKREGHEPGGRDRRAVPPAATAGLRRELHPLLQGQREDHRAEPPVHRREPRL